MGLSPSSEKLHPVTKWTYAVAAICSLALVGAVVLLARGDASGAFWLGAAGGLFGVRPVVALITAKGATKPEPWMEEARAETVAILFIGAAFGILGAASLFGWVHLKDPVLTGVLGLLTFICSIWLGVRSLTRTQSEARERRERLMNNGIWAVVVDELKEYAGWLRKLIR